MTQNRFSISKQWNQGLFAEAILIVIAVIGTQGVAQDSVFDRPSAELQQTSFEQGRESGVNDSFSFDLSQFPMESAEVVDLVRALSVDNGLTAFVDDEASFAENEITKVDLESCEIPSLDSLTNCDALCHTDRAGQQSCGMSTNSRTMPWIFWKDEQCSTYAGPVCCAIQERTVNWRLSSMYLQGCMPSGYSLQCFIETVNNLDFHATMLSSNGPCDRGGSMEDAVAIEGPRTKSIQQVSIDITPPKGELPPDHASEKFDSLPMQIQTPGTHRLWCGTSFYWQASLLNHQPLYFEDVNLERHGFSHGCWQPFISGGLFFSRLPALPYLMTAQRPYETQFTLGETRLGNHACYVCERPPLRLDAAIVEAAAVTGLVFLIP